MDDRFGAMLQMLHSLRHRDDDDDEVYSDDNGRARHRCVTCDHCRTNNITGVRFKCGWVALCEFWRSLLSNLYVAFSDWFLSLQEIYMSPLLLHGVLKRISVVFYYEMCKRLWWSKNCVKEIIVLCTSQWPADQGQHYIKKGLSNIKWIESLTFGCPKV